MFFLLLLNPPVFELVNVHETLPQVHGHAEFDDTATEEEELFRSQDNEWHELGQGDARLPRFRVPGMVRLHMRHENTMNVIGNFVLETLAQWCALVRPTECALRWSEKSWSWWSVTKPMPSVA